MFRPLLLALTIVQGTAVVAKTEGDAIVLFDITPSVRAMVLADGDPDSKLHDVEVEAGKTLLAHLGDVPSAATISVRVVYQRIGAVNPAYATNTFGGVEKLLAVSAPRPLAQKNRSTWSALLAKGTIPSGMSVNVTGKLPPK